MSDPESAILTHLSTSPETTIPDSSVFSSTHNLDHNQVVGVSKSLEADAYVKLTELTTSFFTLSKEAESIVSDGSQEMLVLTALLGAGEAGMAMPELQSAVGKDVCKIGMGNCLKNKWAKKEKDGKLVAVVTLEGVSDEVREQLKSLNEGGGDPKALDDKVGHILNAFWSASLFIFVLIVYLGTFLISFHSVRITKRRIVCTRRLLRHSNAVNLFPLSRANPTPLSGEHPTHLHASKSRLI